MFARLGILAIVRVFSIILHPSCCSSVSFADTRADEDFCSSVADSTFGISQLQVSGDTTLARLTFNAPSHQSKSHRAWKKKGPEQKVGDVESPPFNYSPDESIEIAEYLDDTTTVTTTTTSTITTTTISAQVSDGTALVPNMKMSEAVYRPSHVKELKTTTLAVAKKLTTTTTTVAAQAGYALKPNAKVAEAVYRPSDVKDTTTTVSTTTKFVPTKPPPTVEPQAGYVLEPYFNLASKLPAQRPKNVTDPTTTTTTTTTRRTTTTTTIEPQILLRHFPWRCCSPVS